MFATNAFLIVQQAYCSNGICQDLNAICDTNFASISMLYCVYHCVVIHIIHVDGITPSVGPQECFDFNTDGNQFGNCGHNATAFIACAVEYVDRMINLCQ